MADIILSKAVRSNLLNLQSTASLMGKTQERLATGQKVNSALDNPTSFFTASSLNSRASDLSQLLDSVSNAVQTIAAADKGISGLTKLVETAQATARQALQTSATVEGDGDVAVEEGAVVSGVVAAVANDDFTINGYTVAVAGTDDGAAIYSAMQAAAAESTGTAEEFTVSLNDDGEVVVATTYDGAALDFAGDADSLTAMGLADAAASTSVTDAKSANPKRAELTTQYNDLLDQIDQLAKDSGFNGVNLLDGDDLSVRFNEDGSSKLDIEGVSLSASGLGLTALASTGFDSNTDINTTLDGLKEAVSTLRTQASTFGANLSVVETRQDFTKNMINVLETGAANLTLADTNEEAANLLALQTRQQLSSTALSLASQADQNVLRLF
jgi:flagellin